MTITPLAQEEWTWLGLNADNWIATGSGVVALAGFVVAMRALIHARKSAEASHASAMAAQKSADEAATISRIELDRRHDDLAPAHPGELRAEERSDPQHPGYYNLFGSITVPRDYRVRAEMWNGTALSPIALPLLLRANQSQRFHIDRVPTGATDSTAPIEVRIHFWPPVPDLDDTAPWTCACERQTGTDISGRGHWELRIPITYVADLGLY